MLDSSTVGTALRDAREMAGMPRRAAARRVGVPPRVLRSWEHRSALPRIGHIARAARVYSEGTELELPARTPLTTPHRPGVLFVGDEQIVRDLELAVTDPDREIADLLHRYVSAVRRARGLHPSDAVALRAADLLALAAEVDVTHERLHHLLADILHLDRHHAAATRRALVVGALITLVASGAIPDSFVARSPRLLDDSTVPGTWRAVPPGPLGPEPADLSPFSTMSEAQRPADARAGASLVATSVTAPVAGAVTQPFSTCPAQRSHEQGTGRPAPLGDPSLLTTPFSTGPAASNPRHGSPYGVHPTASNLAPGLALTSGQLFSPAGTEATVPSTPVPVPQPDTLTTSEVPGPAPG